MAQVEQGNTEENVQLESGTYELLRSRLGQNGSDLQLALGKLNDARKEVFGTIENSIIGTERITTQNNCVPWDMVPIGSLFLFGYNVHMGLKTETELSDVFSVYEYSDKTFHEKPLDLIKQKEFVKDFNQLYKYYKNTQFVKFAKFGPFLHMVFRTGKDIEDIKTFKWKIFEGTIEYIDNRSTHEFTYPEQHQFRWKRTTRDNHREGKHPHISVEEKVFVETLGGDLTIKVENNTEDGKGIYSEPVDHKDQILADAEVQYTVIGHLIILKIRPYQEDFRYILYNSKLGKAQRIDELAESCILLPDDHGIIFTNGYYLQNGEFKRFDNSLQKMVFENRIDAPNGEDFLYIFYNRENGIYLLLNYNLIKQKVENPMICHGYSIFENGEMCLFKADREAKKHHVVQIWQTPFTGPDFLTEVVDDSLISRIGNKEIVRAMAECQEIINLIEKEEVFATLYIDLIKMCTDVSDSYHCLNKEELFKLSEPLLRVKDTAAATVEEYEKVTRIKENTANTQSEVFEKVDQAIRNVKKTHAEDINEYVQLLSQLRTARGEVISLKDLRYNDEASIEKNDQLLQEYIEDTSQKCVKFLLKENSLKPYTDRVKKIGQSVDAIDKVTSVDKTGEEVDKVSEELKMLIDTVSSLSIEDTTETTRIIDQVSNIYADINQVKSALKKKRNNLKTTEGKAEFIAQMKLIDQAVINFLDISDTPEKADEYLTKLMVQLEELEGKFSDFEEFIEKVIIKRDDVYNAFESRKVALIETRNKRASILQQSAERIISSVKSRISRFDSVVEINGYMSSDMMIEKIRKIVEELRELGDSVKAEDILSKLKSTKEDAVRQLKDKSELYLDGENLVKFGDFNFAVNKQNLDLTIVPRNGNMHYHLTGTNFFELISDNEFNSLKDLWSQELISESKEIYRAEFLVWQLLNNKDPESENYLSAEELYNLDEESLMEYIRKFMSTRYDEGYLKGVHDHDAFQLLKAVLETEQTADLLKYPSVYRAASTLFWQKYVDQERKELLNHQLKGAGLILRVFPKTSEFEDLLNELELELAEFLNENELFPVSSAEISAKYLFDELTHRDRSGERFALDKETGALHHAFMETLTKNKATKDFRNSVKSLESHSDEAFLMIRKWINAFIDQTEHQEWREYVDECAVTILLNDFHESRIIHANLKFEVADMRGDHELIKDGKYQFDYNSMMTKLIAYQEKSLPRFNLLKDLKKSLAHDFSEELRLSEFKPRILSSFVRNQLIDEVYLPLIGANLAKQIGAAGDQKRTDLNGLLLLISPPGYGKTTLMEYIANRLGIIFMKINGPALGHTITSLDPGEAPNATSKEELEKMNLAFEMGDNVMIYLDDIQHCNPELLQKFISLCDAQRKIEGVYKGRSKTYDFRGKKVCVIMAGNPYTESGEKFQIPDMLANRADIYNLGDIIGDSESNFMLSYIENALTSNPILKKAAAKSHNDVIKMVRIVETGKQEGINYEANHSQDEISECIELLKKVLKVRDVIYRVNKQYIASAAQADEYRVEPPFKLQGSYRDMNKIVEKLVPVMNDDELKTIILSHYQNESQTLTSGAEANMLKFKELYGIITDEEKERWAEILATFLKSQRSKGYGENNQAGLMIEQMVSISESLDGIKDEILKKMKVFTVAKKQRKT